jgi:hypothetical protein
MSLRGPEPLRCNIRRTSAPRGEEVSLAVSSSAFDLQPTFALNNKIPSDAAIDDLSMQQAGPRVDAIRTSRPHRDRVPASSMPASLA